MRNIILILLLAAFCSCNETDKSNSKDLVKYGNPLSIELTAYDGAYKFGEIQKTKINSFRQQIFEEPYDEYFDSNEPEYYLFNSIYHYVFIFNKKGNFQKIYLLSYSKKDSKSFFSAKEGMDTLYIADYEYPTDNEIKITLTKRDPLFAFSYGSSVDGDTASIRYDYLLPNGKLDSSVYKSYFPEFVSTTHTKCKYETNKETLTTYESNNSISEVVKTIIEKNKETTYVYNRTGNLIQEIIRLEPEKNIKIRIDKKYRYDELVYQKTDSSFFKNDLLIKKRTFLKEKRTSVNYTSKIENNYEYKFDNKKNWIERTRTFKEMKTVRNQEYINEGIHITEKKIKYY